MFDKLSECLEKLIKNKFTEEVSFERPSEEYERKVSVPTVNAFLYDVREDTQLRASERSREPRNGVDRVMPPSFYVTWPLCVTCSYVITAWSKVSTDRRQESLLEQRLLGQVMQFLARQPEIPENLPGNDFKCPIPLRISTYDEKGSLSEFWTALGNKIRPSFVLNATIAFEAFKEEKPTDATSLSITIGPIDKGEWRRGDPFYLIGGKVTLSNTADRGKEVRVRIEELGRETKMDENGSYQFFNVPGSGDKPYTLVALIDDNRRQPKHVYVPRTKQNPDDYDFTL